MSALRKIKNKRIISILVLEWFWVNAYLDGSGNINIAYNYSYTYFSNLIKLNSIFFKTKINTSTMDKYKFYYICC